jgi:site-specific DNA-methyltransferase (adenine-specific)
MVKDISIIKGDCHTELMKIDSNSVSLIFSDPPYNLIGLDAFVDVRTYFVQFRERLAQYKRILMFDGTLIFCGRPPIVSEMLMIAQEHGFVFYDWITWHKVDSITPKKDGYSTNYEVFVIVSKSGYRKFNHIPVESKSGKYGKEVNAGSIWQHCKISSNHNEGTKHPTQKPIKFLSTFVCTFTNEGDLVVDDFNGSGTTAEACAINKRRYKGFEINEDYIEITNGRLEKYNTVLI